MSVALGIVPATSLYTGSAYRFFNDDHFDYGTFDAPHHIRMLHPENTRNGGGIRKGVISFAQRVPDGRKNWKEWTVPVGGDAIFAAEELLRGDVSDLYVSQQAFHRWRGVADLAAVGACYVDIDYQTRVRWQGTMPEAMADRILIALDEKRILAPSYILSTGRGLVCVWLTELLPPIVLPRWNTVQKHLANVLTEFGADKRAVDAARVFRLVGSINSKAEWDRRRVGMVWCQGTPEAPKRLEFSTLADEILPHTQAELISLRAARVNRKARGQDCEINPAQKLTAATYWATVLEDLQKIRKYRNPLTESLPAGQRDAWLFVAATALSWLAPPAVMEREINILARQAAGWSNTEAQARMKAVLNRAKSAADGRLMLFNGQEIDPRYRMKAETIAEWLAIESEEMEKAGLRVLIDNARKKERAAERQAEFRHKQGAKDRTQQQAARLELGRKCLYLSAKNGMNRESLAYYFQVSTGQISKAMREARIHST